MKKSSKCIWGADVLQVSGVNQFYGGSHILRHFLPYRAVQLYDRMGMFGLIILFLVGGRFIGAVFSPIFATFNQILFTL